MTTVWELISGRQFLYGALFGFGGLVVSFLARRRKFDWGLIWAGAVIAATLAAGIFELRLGRRFEFVWLLPALGAAAAGAAGLIRLKDHQVVVPALVVSLAGIWATTPDTEKIAVQLGVTAVMLWVWYSTKWTEPGVIGAVAVAILVGLAATSGGVGRTTGLIGALGSLATIGFSAWALPANKPVLWLTGHTLVVLTWSRWAGLTDSTILAVVIGLAAWGVAAGVGLLSDRPTD